VTVGPLVRQYRSSLAATFIAKCLRRSRLSDRHRRVPIIWAWSLPNMIGNCSARLLSVTCRVPPRSLDHESRTLVTHFGFTRTPFSKTIPAGQLCDRASHQEAVARIRFCIGARDG